MNITDKVNGIISKVNSHTSSISSIDTLNSSHIELSGATAYHLLQGNVSLSNEVITNGFSTTLYTGNGSTQSITTGVDMSTQWGNSSSETYGGLVWVKDRTSSSLFFHQLSDTVRGANYQIFTNSTNAQENVAGKITGFTSTGFTVGNNTAVNTSSGSLASWNFQTTHRVTGTTNHGKAYTCHYNPYTGFTMVKYEGSGIAGHEIPHHLGRKLGFVTTKLLNTANNWTTQYRENNFLKLNLAEAESSITDCFTSFAENAIVAGSNASVNGSGITIILYGWANSYFDDNNKLIGNYEIGTYTGTGVAGNKVTTRGKPAWVMIKRLDSTGHWVTYDNQRTTSKFLCPNLSQAEDSSQALGVFNSDGFTINNVVWSDLNTSGGQYLYMVVYDNDSGSGKSKYPRTTDTTQIQLNNAIIPLAKGIDSKGVKVSTVSKNETISVSLQQGTNYIAYVEEV